MEQWLDWPTEESNCISCVPPPEALQHDDGKFKVYGHDGEVLCSSCDPTIKPSSCCSPPAFEVQSSEAGEEDRNGSVTAGGVFKKLSWLDCLLPIWIIGAMALGILLGYFVPAVERAFNGVKIDEVSLPIAIGLWAMMWPVLTKVRYELLGGILSSRAIWSQLAISLVANWLLGPAVMVAFAWATLPDLPHYRAGVILVGLARCIAMVLLWNQLANGSPEYCAILVAVNSILQIILYAPLALFYLEVVSGGAGAAGGIHIGFWQVARSVLLFLGVPLVAGIITRYSLLAFIGEQRFEKNFMPYFGPVALLGLIYTIIVMFSLQGHQVIANIGDVCRVAVPMVLYFGLMFFGTLAVCWKLGTPYDQSVTQAFTASSNNFELAIAIAVGTFGIKSQEALAATIGPLIEVPVLLALVYVALALHKKWWGARSAA
ncbi:g7013 [Coccomyxa elongata]